MSPVAVNMEDLKKIVADEVSSATSKVIGEALEKAQDAAARATREGTVADLVSRAVKAGETPVAVVDQRSLQVIHDPHKGKGLGFARFAKTALAAKVLGQDARELAHSWSKQGHRDYSVIADAFDAQRRGMSEGSFGAGGGLVPVQYAAEFIELLYPQVVSQKLGAGTMEFQRQLVIGKLNQGVTVSYIGEAANIVPSQPGTGQLSLSAKKAGAAVPVTNEMLRNPSVGAETIIRDDLLRAMAVRRDLSFYRGAGDTFQPKGMNKWVNSANVFASTGTTLAQKVADMIKAIRLVDESNVGLGTGGFAMAPRSKWALAATLDNQGQFVFAAMLASGQLFGFQLGATTSIPTNLGGGSDSEVYFGAHGDAIIGLDTVEPLMIETFPNGTYNDGSSVVSGISSDQSVIRVLEAHDMLLRHDKSFAQITGVAWT